MVRGFFWYNKDEETRLDSWLMMSLRLAFASPFFVKNRPLAGGFQSVMTS